MSKRSYKKVTKTEFNNYRKLARAGYTPAQIAKSYGVKAYRVRNAFYNRGTSFSKEFARGLRAAAKDKPANTAKPNNIWPHMKLGFLISAVVAAAASVAFIVGA